ncbi:hypothetical protein FISHEDRAFT_49362 [Fistulina hepatica ATCC 64428]|uniref:Defect at low temperature protein 1 n=1 Tax=Fistulina hepatica ATCC 64428 TaxID=1128425 RepID=A0A0D7A4T9_9AGAR|nr:hypothetical protein FISHEDRAFT_49362 [Fistulina hepatica ATCC 64428]
MISRRLFLTISRLAYVALVLIIATLSVLSCVAILSQAIRNSPTRSWKNNFDAPIVGAAYVAVLVVSLSFCLKRRLAVTQKMQRIHKVQGILMKNDFPRSVHDYITLEYARACLVAHESLPKDVSHTSWGRPGTKYANINFRRSLLDSITELDRVARQVLPNSPLLKPRARILQHFCFILPLLTVDADDLTALHYYDSAIQIARNSHAEVTEQEYELGMKAQAEIIAA